MILAEYGNSDITALIRKKICQEESRKPYVSPGYGFFPDGNHLCGVLPDNLRVYN